MRLYYHKTDGGAEYLTDKYIISPDGSKEGVFKGARYIVRIDGDIRRDAELVAMPDVSELLLAARCAEADLHGFVLDYLDLDPETSDHPAVLTCRELKQAIANAEGR